MNDFDRLSLNVPNDGQWAHFQVNWEHIFDTIIKDYCPYLPKSEDLLMSSEVNRNKEYWEYFVIKYLPTNLKDAIVKFLVDPLSFKSEDGSISDVYDLVKEYSASTSKIVARCRILFLVLFMSKEFGNEMHQILNEQLKIEVPIDLVEYFVQYLKSKYASAILVCVSELVDDVKSENPYKSSEIVMKAVRRAEMRLCVMRHSNGIA
jgi:hypothetical protein